MHSCFKRIDKICQISGVAGASIGVVHNSQVLHTHNFGFSNCEAKSPTSSGTIYGIGSVTKSFVSAAIGKLVDEGKLAWDTRIKDILPDFHHDNDIVTEMLTITDILSHRCGLGGGGAMNLAFQGDGDMLLPKQTLLDLVNHFPVVFPLRQSWDYWVWGYAIAGLVIEKLTEKSLDDFLSDTLFRPLGLTATSFRVPRSSENLAEPYAALSDRTPFHLPKRQTFEDTFFEASGGIWSSVDDLLVWACATLDAIKDSGDAQVLKEIPYIVSNHAAILNPSLQERSYGLGWARSQLPGIVGLIGDNFPLWSMQDQPVLGDKHHPLLMLYHQGSTVGYFAHLALFPDTQSAIVVLVNSIALSDAPDWISRLLTQALFGLDDGNDYVALAEEGNRRQVAEFEKVTSRIAEMRMSCPESNPPVLDDFAGRYVNKSKLFHIDIARSSKKGGELELRFQGRDSQAYELRYLCGNVFEWSLSHDESKKRGRYNIAELEFFLFRFQIDTAERPLSFSWVNDPTLPGDPELFFREDAGQKPPGERSSGCIVC